MWDVQNRVLNLSQLGLFPRIFGQDVTKIFKQKYYGNLTLVPRFTTMQIFGLKSLVNPTVADMEIYLQNGQLAAWPFLRVLKEMLRIEKSIDACLSKLNTRLQTGFDIPMSNTNDDMDSLSSALGAAHRARLPGLSRETELLKEKNQTLEHENLQLKKQVTRLQRALGISHTNVMDAGGNRGVVGLEGRLVSVSRVVEEEGALEEDLLRLEEKKST